MDATTNASTNQPSPAADQLETDPAAAAAAAKAERIAKRDRRRDAAAKWVPNRSTPFKNTTLVLHSDQSQKVFYLGLIHAQRSLYHFYHTLPAGNEALEAAETIIEQKFTSIEERLTSELGRLKSVAEGIAAEPVSGYSSPQTIEVPMYTQEADRFGRLLMIYDEIVQWADALMFAGNMKRSYRANVIQEGRNSLIRFSRQIHLLHMQARNSLRRADRERVRARQANQAAKAKATQEKAGGASATGASDKTDDDSDSPAPTKPAAEKTETKKTATKKAATKTATKKTATKKTATKSATTKQTDATDADAPITATVEA